MTEALGGVSFIHLTAPTGEKLVVESREDFHARIGAMVGLGFAPGNALCFAADFWPPPALRSRLARSARPFRPRRQKLTRCESHAE